MSDSGFGIRLFMVIILSAVIKIGKGDTSVKNKLWFQFLRNMGLVTVIFQVSWLSAESMPVDDVVAAARGWLALTDAAPLGDSLGSGLTFMTPGQDDQGELLYYAVSLENGGVLVMAPDDAIEPVIAFAPEAGDLSDPDPCNHLRLMLEADMADRLADVKSGTVKNADAKAAKWALLIAAAKDPSGVKSGLGSVSDLRVGPLTYTKWSQSYVYQGSTKIALYNYYTPPFNTPGSYQNYYCGCVATALAQMMWYHRYPQKGVGAISCSIRVNGAPVSRSTRGGNGSGGAYDWSNMPADPGGLAKAGRLTSTQRMAVGALCHDAAVASKMNFTPSGSGAPLCWAKGNHPLQTVFSFANVDSPWVDADSTFSKSDINSALNPSLDAGLPGALAINNDSGAGHAVVVDGYGYAYGALYHHLNMGWGGADTAWYNLPAVKDVQNSPYFRVSGMVFNADPRESGISVISGRVLDLAGKPLAGVKVVAKPTSGSNPNQSALSNARGIYAIKAPTGQYRISGSYAGLSFSPESRTVSAGSGTVRNSWFNNFKAVSRIMRLSTRDLAFGKVSVYTIQSLPLKVFNDGTTTLTVSGIDCPDGFWADPASFTVPPNGGSALVTIKFNPSDGVLYQGALTLRSNRSRGPCTVTVSGKGQGTGLGVPGMALIPAGDFTMGDTFTEGSSDEWPSHPVTVSAFYIGRTEVTKQLWDEVRSWGATNGYTDLSAGFGKATNHPVTLVSWFDCIKWCNARSEKEGRTPVYYTLGSYTEVMRTGFDYSGVYSNALWSANGYRLPTEAEWEKAARGGLSRKRFPWGNTISHSQANYFSSASYSYDVSPTRGAHPSYSVSDPHTSPVASFGANGYGLYDMAGNASEICWDWSGAAYSSLPVTDPRGPSSGVNRVIRGGGFGDYAVYCRVAKRLHVYPEYNWYNNYGFRVVLPAGP